MNSLEFEPGGQCAQCGEELLPVVGLTFLLEVEAELRTAKVRICAGCLSEAHGFVVANTTKELPPCQV